MGKITRITGGGRGDTSQQRLHLREIPREVELAQMSVGENLRAARLERREDVAQVSQALRIRKDYLEALESDCPTGLPGRTYALGFVRSYANYLGLDAFALVARYKLATEGLAECTPQVGPPPKPGGSGWRTPGTLAVLAVAAVLVYGVYQLSQPPGSPGPLATSTAKEARISTPASRHRPPISSASRALPGPASAAGNLPPLSTGQTFGQQNRDVRVVVHTLRAAHVLVEGPGGRIYINRLLHPGDVYRVPNLVGLSLTTADGGAVSLELDGRNMGAAGRSGQMAEALPLDPPAIVDRTGAGAAGQVDKVTP